MPAGWNGIDTLQVCTTVGTRTVSGTATYFTNRNAGTVGYVYLSVRLERDGVVIRPDTSCHFYDVPAYDERTCPVPVAGNVRGVQAYVTKGASSSGGVRTRSFSPLVTG